jgi:hypothetical protein
MGTPSATQEKDAVVAAGVNDAAVAVSTPPTFAMPVIVGSVATTIVPGAVGAVAAETLLALR